MRCFRLEIALPSLRSLRRFAAPLVCLALLAGCRFGGATSFFDDDGAIEQAVAAIRERVGKPVHVFNLLITPDEVTIRIQDPNNRNRIDEWRLDRMHVVAVNWDRVTGPSAYQLTLINPDLEANLFDLDEIDFAASAKLARAAVERSSLAGKARVNRMEIARRTYILPTPSSGEIQWTVDVTSDRESMQAFADAHGTIVGMNIDGTDRAKNLDILRNPGLVANAARAFRFILGPEKILMQANVSTGSVGFATNLPDQAFPIPVSGSLTARRVYTWNLNGLQPAIGKVSADAALGPSGEPFSVDDVDWNALPKIVTAATQQLAMPQGIVTGIEVSKPINAIGPSVVLWKIEIADQNKERGFILADTTGAVKQVMQPESRRKVSDWYDPKTMFDTFARLGVDFGHDRQYAEITFLNDKVLITAQDHMQPDVSRDIILSDNGYDRAGTPSILAGTKLPFRIGDLSALTAERIRDLETKTLETLKMPPKTIASITIGRGSMDPSPNGNVTIEIRAEERPGGRAGRVNYELDGKVIRTYLP